ncbi:hypothetical protein [Halorarum salinum]|uniref:Transcriptional regulator n=1 Tax=Halorarum salinum TaxID=2743089 RepID=A0A7D5L965_9EURY|nr:hypothetical protein [Halobaculum salinum]QLG60887.1 hypothetical protein HUG12_03660 [Halobaculum salinum]
MTDDPEWPTEATVPVARLLYQAGVALSPAGVRANLVRRTDDPPSPGAVRDAIDAMRERGLVRSLDDGEHYLLTGSGREYVETEIDQEGVGFVD